MPNEITTVFKRQIHKTALVALAVGMVMAAQGFAASQTKVTLEGVGSKVFCLCGCATTLNHCPHLPSECQSRAEMQALILADIRQGKNEPAILQDLTNRYGVRVLAAPPTNGFDLTAWVLPGFGLVLGLGIVVIIVSRWRRKPSASFASASDLHVDAKLMAAVEEEMTRLGSSRR
ncbi:MAG TPA: cytochrome c-type biogenesis protein CcmH [Terriglobia bacterium]|nr:cytochrome c-type biogenesis protein CcmH [Terriglobia bacterium]